jgi:hypothetical protein
MLPFFLQRRQSMANQQNNRDRLTDEKRAKRAQLGTVEFGSSSRIQCTIRSLSAFGAALDVAAASNVPDEFALTVAPHFIRRRCAVVWRKDDRIAVAFY